ncbi:MAG: CoA transferase [Chloroflexi bacterium]|nr:CoA transferase [Chloroflexota bacterium]
MMAEEQRRGALSGLRVLDLSSAIAMPFCAMMMADMGAEVIKVESHTRINDRVWGALITGIFPENEPGDLYWEESANFHILHRSKLGVTLDLKHRQAIDLLKRLVALSDVVIENNRPGVMERLGVGYEVLRSIKPDLIMLSNTGFGRTGPWSHYPGLASMLEPVTGLAYAAGYLDGTPERIGNAYIDYLSAWNGLAAILAALHYRRRTGKGQYIDQSMIQIGMHTVVEPLLDHQISGRETERRENRHRWMAPHAVYPCAGDDRWIAICVRTDAEWQRLCQIMGCGEAAADPRFADTLSRYEHQAEIDQLVAAWTRERDAFEIMAALQSAGIAAGVVQTPRDLFLNPQLRERGFYQIVEHTASPRVGPRPIQGIPFKMSATPPRITKPAPGLGEDNYRIFGELLGLSREEMEQLEREGVISGVPVLSPGDRKPDTLSLDEQKELGVIRDYDPNYRELLGIAEPAEAARR